MLCRQCMIIMKTGTTYERKKEHGQFLARRFHKCKKCGDKIYTKESNFQEYLNNSSQRNKFK